MRLLPLLLAPLMTGCVVVQDPFDEELSSRGVSMVVADVDRGSLDYSGVRGGEYFVIEGISQGTGSSRSRAEAKADDNDWSFEVVGQQLEIDTSSDRGQVFLDVMGPEIMDTDIIVESGGVFLEDVEGSHMITADRVETRGVVGVLDLYSHSGTVDVEIFPWDNGFVTIESHGTTTLRLPAGLDYDIEVWGDPEYSMTIEDLVFYDSYMGEGYFSAETGRGSIEVDVHVYGGAFTLYEAW